MVAAWKLYHENAAIQILGNKVARMIEAIMVADNMICLVRPGAAIRPVILSSCPPVTKPTKSHEAEYHHEQTDTNDDKPSTSVRTAGFHKLGSIRIVLHRGCSA